jgi:hypothetical protein
MSCILTKYKFLHYGGDGIMKSFKNLIIGAVFITSLAIVSPAHAKPKTPSLSDACNVLKTNLTADQQIACGMIANTIGMLTSCPEAVTLATMYGCYSAINGVLNGSGPYIPNQATTQNQQDEKDNDAINQNEQSGLANACAECDGTTDSSGNPTPQPAANNNPCPASGPNNTGKTCQCTNNGNTIGPKEDVYYCGPDDNSTKPQADAISGITGQHSNAGDNTGLTKGDWTSMGDTQQQASSLYGSAGTDTTIGH